MRKKIARHAAPWPPSAADCTLWAMARYFARLGLTLASAVPGEWDDPDVMFELRSPAAADGRFDACGFSYLRRLHSLWTIGAGTHLRTQEMVTRLKKVWRAGHGNNRQSVLAWVYGGTSVELVARTLSTWGRRADWAVHIVSLGAPSMRVIAMLPDVASEVREAMATFLIAQDREALDSSVSSTATVVCNRRL